MKLINMTPHEVNYFDNQGFRHSIPAGCKVFRVRMDSKLEHSENDINFYSLTTIPVDELPAKEDTVYIVSRLVKECFPKRLDVVCPGEPVYDSDSNKIGCKGFTSTL